MRYNDEDEEEEEEYGHNADIAMLELYSQSARDEVLLVRALVDDQEVEVLIFKVRLYWVVFEPCFSKIFGENSILRKH